MGIEPGYGETLVSEDELDALLPRARALLGEPVSKAAVFDLEQGIQEATTKQLLSEVLSGALQVPDLLTDFFVKDLHALLYGDLWDWAGIFRKREANIGSAPEMIATETRTILDTILYRWQHTDDWTPHQFGIAVHAETVRIHPFVDGNGRTTRLLADLVFAATQDSTELEQYDWNLDKKQYITLLRDYDGHRDVGNLAKFIHTRSVEG